MTDSNFVIKKGLDIFDGDVSLKGSNKELRFYEGANYVGFEAPALSADKIWVLPNADGSTGQALKTDGSGNLGWANAGDVSKVGTPVNDQVGVWTGDGTLEGTSKFTFNSSNNLTIGGGAVYPRIILAGNNGFVYFKDNSSSNPAYQATVGVNGGQFQIGVGSGNTLALGIHPSGGFALGTGNYGTAGQVLTTQGQNSLPTWTTVSSGGATAIGGLSDAITTATNNVGLGSGALDSITATSGNHNSALGVDALTAVSTGDYNVAIGKEAGAGLQSGSYNTFLGSLAGGNTGTDAHSNVIVGFQTAYSSTSLTKSVAVGYEAGKFGMKSATDNISIGYQSMKGNFSNSTGANYNLAIGTESLEAITTGDYNVGLGYKTLEAITTGVRNIAIGAQALDAADTESDNIAIGYDALGGSVNGGEKNLAIGNYAGEAITSADNTVLLGYEAGKSITGSTDSIGIGYQAGKSMGNQTIAIGSLSASVGAGWRNIMIGYGAGKRTNDHDNVVIGWEAGDEGTAYGQSVFIGSMAGKRWGIGDKNVAIGYGSGGQQELASGNDAQYNTVIGHGSGDNVTDGDYNVFLGQSSGDNITTGSGNVVIGAADVSSATGNDQLSISSGDGDVTWITGTSDSGVLIGDGTVPNGSTAGQLTISNPNANTFAHTLLLVDSEDDNTNGPVLTLYRNSATPADNDILGKIQFNCEDSNGDPRAYSNIRAVANDVTNGTHDGTLHMNIAIAGTQTDILAVDSTGGYGGLTHTPSGIKTLGNVVGATSTANNGYITLLAVPHANFKAIKASIHITDSSSNEVQTMDVMCHYDGSAANYTSYGIIFDGAAAIGEIEVDINSSNIRIRFKNTQGATRTLAGSIHAVCHP